MTDLCKKCGTQVANHDDRSTLCQLFAEARKQGIRDGIALAKARAFADSHLDGEWHIDWSDVDAKAKEVP